MRRRKTAFRYTAHVTTHLFVIVLTLTLGLNQAPSETANLQLLQAATTGDAAAIRAALVAGADVNGAADTQITALGAAALYGHLEVVAALLAAGAEVEMDQGGQTALMLAAGQGHTAVVEALLARGADIAAKDKEGLTALMAAASANRADTVRALLTRGAAVNAANAEGSTALMAAAYGGHIETVQILLAAGADVNGKDRSGRTSLMAAALGGSAPVVRTLLAHKADVAAEDAGGSTSLIYAAANGHIALIELLQKAGLSKGTDLALAFAVRDCHADVVRKLAAGGARLDARVQGQPPVLLAAAANCGEVLNFLIERGVDVNAADDRGMTALMAAGAEGFVPIVQTLLAHGADLERTNKNKENAWLIAAMRNQREVIELFRAARETKKR
jgi:ankyrin repeat protein